MFTKRSLFVALSLIVIASMALTACGNAASPAEAAQACGELGVKSFDSKGFECNEAPAAATAESVPTQESAPTAAPSPTAEPTTTPQIVVNSCFGGATIVSSATDWTVVVVEASGRIWQPCLLDGSIRPAFTVTFVAPATGSFTFNGVNASLQLDGKVIAENVNGKTVSIVNGKTYTVVNGKTNGGFELLPLSQ